MQNVWVRAVLVLIACLANGLVRAAELPNFTTIVQLSAPAVVKIVVEAGHKDQRGNCRAPSPGARDREGSPTREDMRDLLRRFFDELQPQQLRRKSRAAGSGFIVSSDGYIVTNHHVVECAESLLVRLLDRREFAASIVGLDKLSDIALLRIDAKGLPVLKLGRPDALQVGEWVLAIGSPFNLDYSVAAGIVSAMGRSLPSENYVPFIQTDVAINPGNSGGPLFNLAGEVVGVNSQIYSATGGSHGVSFAIPVSVVSDVIEQIKRSGEVTRGWLGVTIQNVTQDLAEAWGLDRPAGALISGLVKGGPGATGGLMVGDVITRFDGAVINASADLPHVVGLTRPASTANVAIMRDGKQQLLHIVVGSLNADRQPVRLTGSGDGSGGGRLGIVVDDIVQRQPLPRQISIGVVVDRVIPGSPADEAGVQRGDRITWVAGSKIHSVADYERSLARTEPDQPVRILFHRGARSFFIALQPEAG